MSIWYVTFTITFLDFSPADFKRFLTDLADRPLFGNHCFFRTGLVANGIRLTKRCAMPRIHAAKLHVVFRILTILSDCWFGVFSHKPAAYCIMITHLTSNSFEGNSCWPHAEYLPTLRFWFSPSYHVHREWIFFSLVNLNQKKNWDILFEDITKHKRKHGTVECNWVDDESDEEVSEGNKTNTEGDQARRIIRKHTRVNSVQDTTVHGQTIGQTYQFLEGTIQSYGKYRDWHIWTIVGDRSENKLWVSELLLNANSAIYQLLYHGENKLIFNEMMMRSALY